MTVTIEYTLEEIAVITGGQIIHHPSTVKFTYLLLDSRKLLYPELTIFFAVRSQLRHGIQFINDLYEKGVMNFLIDENMDVAEFPMANFLRVQNTVDALQALAAFHRKRFAIPVIGITGSNGKTIVKEWLDQLLAVQYNIIRSPRSFNSQVGVPLSILQMNSTHTLAIFEAGISEAGEMERLEKMIVPTIGILTNIGDAHDAGFSSRIQKLEEKFLLFKNAEVIICHKKDVLPPNAEGDDHHREIFTWEFSDEATLLISGISKDNSSTSITAVFKEEELQIKVPFTDDASIENAITCLATLLQLKISVELIKKRMINLQPVEMRLELKQGINHCSIINDSYSADVHALSIATDFLVQQQQHSRRTVILSDILESGRDVKDLYREVATILLKKNINRFIGIGTQIRSERQQFTAFPETHFFDSVQEFITHFTTLHFNNETILLKGARVFGFEQISRLLEQKVHQTILSINLSAITHNLREYKKFLKPGTKVMAMVKAFSYGSGSYEIANLLQFLKVDYLAVAYADEGVELRKAGITLPIIVMNPEESTFNSMQEFDLEPEIFSFFILDLLEKYLLVSGIDNYPVHIKLDTGMHRLGFDANDIDKLADHLSISKKIKVRSVFSHLVASEDLKQDEFSNRQASIFNNWCSILSDKLNYSFIKHLANTSAIHRHPDLQMDMVRLGIGLYGIDADPGVQKHLKNVGTLTTTIAQIRLAKKGESIGYGGKNVIDSDCLIATVRIGYADGYPRTLSNGVGKMLIKGQLVPVVGNVCMDMTMLDITGSSNVHEGDEVIVYGEQLPVQDLAKWANTITYDIISGISQRVKRVYYEE